MVEQVTYEVGLKDKLSAGIGHMNAMAKELESTLLGVVGKGLAIFSSFEFLKGTVEDFNNAAQASAQLNATMTSTGNIARLNREALDEQAGAIMNASLFDDDDITRAQSILATFTNIRGEIFMNTIPAIADMSTKMGTDLKGAVLQVGKAMNDLTGKGLTMLKKSGVDFNDTQVKMIRHLFETNRVAEAQTIILQELQKEFGGSAAAAAEAGTGPFTVLQHQFANVKEEIGGMLVALGTELMPTLKKFVEVVKDSVGWIRDHAAMLKAVAVGAASAWAAFKLLSGASAILLALENALVAVATGSAAATEGVTAFGLALDITPLGAFAAALGLIAFAYERITGAAAEAAAAKAKYLGDTKNDETDLVTQGTAKYKSQGKDDKTAFSMALKDEENDIATRSNATKKALAEEQAIIDAAYKKSKGNIQDLAYEEKQRLSIAVENANFLTKDLEVTGARSAGLEALKKTGLIKPKTSDKYDTPAAKAEKTKATGAKSVTINVQIKELIGINNMNTTTIKESMSKVHDAVVSVITGAVNDFQVVASST